MNAMLRTALSLAAILSASANAAVSDYFVSTDYVADNMDKLTIIDARGHSAYLKGHLPDSISVPWPSLSFMDVEKTEKGWGTLLDNQQLTKKLETLGLETEDEIVVYADTPHGSGEEGRVAWSLKQVGFNNVKIMDGSYSLWREKGYDTSINPILFTSDSELDLPERDLSTTIDTPELEAHYDDFVIIDTRTTEEYNGAADKGETRGGHLPGAIHLPFTDLVNDKGELKPAAEIDAIMKKHGITKKSNIVTYCTSGIRSAHMLMVLKAAGYETVRNYDASYIYWAALPHTKVH